MLQSRDGGISIQLIWLVIVVLFTLVDLVARKKKKGQQPPPPQPTRTEAEMELEDLDAEIEEIPAEPVARRPDGARRTAEDWFETEEAVPEPTPRRRTEADAVTEAEGYEDRAKARLEEQIDQWLFGGERKREAPAPTPSAPAPRHTLDPFESDVREMAEARYASILERREIRRTAEQPIVVLPTAGKTRRRRPALTLDPHEARRAVVLMTVLGPCRGRE